MSVRTNVSMYRQTATLSEPSTPTADGDGAYEQTYVALDPATWRCAIERATVTSAERHFAESVIAQATHVIRGRYHSGITTSTRVQWTDRAGTVHVANVIDEVDVEGAGVETIVAAVEVTNPVLPTDDTSWTQAGWMQ